MMSRIVLHKRNGHRPAPGAASASELVRLVHSAPTSLSDVDVAKLSAVLSSESRTGPTAPADGDTPALAAAFARTREALARGELPQLRAALDALTSRAELAAGLVEHLADTVRATASRAPVARRALVDINEALLHALGRCCAETPGTVEVSSRFDPQLPPVPGDEPQLREAFRELMRAVTRSAEASGRSGALALGTWRRDGVLRGEPIVRIVIAGGDEPADVAGDSAGDPSGDIAGRVARIVEEHGGVLSTRGTEAGHLHFTIELPAI